MGTTAWIGWSAAAVAAAAAIASPAAHAQHAYRDVRPDIRHSPAPIIVNPVPVRTWVPGHWVHTHQGAVWVDGHWIVSHPGHHHVPLHHWRGSRFDQDRDGIPNRHDRDIDGDGVPNWRDRSPRSPHWR
jgi:hypothetical protein